MVVLESLDLDLLDGMDLFAEVVLVISRRDDGRSDGNDGSGGHSSHLICLPTTGLDWIGLDCRV